MWRCTHCGAEIEHGVLCSECERPIHGTLNVIRRKARKVSLRDSVVHRWIWPGAITGFFLGTVLSLLFAAAFGIRFLISPSPQYTIGDFMVFVMVVFVSQALHFFPLLFAFIFLVFGSLIRPIWIALFCSVERFERECGTTGG
jgi:hypothetical protein